MKGTLIDSVGCKIRGNFSEQEIESFEKKGLKFVADDIINESIAQENFCN